MSRSRFLGPALDHFGHIRPTFGFGEQFLQEAQRRPVVRFDVQGLVDVVDGAIFVFCRS